MRKETSDAPALIARIAAALDEAFSGDARLHASVAKLQRLGLSIAVRIELREGSAGPEVIVEGRDRAVPQWSAADEDLLRSLGIATDPHERPSSRQPKSGRRQPR